jgi:hypothetical protein
MRLLGAVLAAVVAGSTDQQYLVMTLPSLRQIAYVKLPDPTLRVLVLSGLVAPKSLAVDNALYRLYVTDSAQQKVFWYQLSIVGDKLIQNGVQHIALETVETNNIAVDGTGNMYFTGKQLLLPPNTPTEGVWRNAAINLHTGATKVPATIYSGGNTGAPPAFSASSGVATDNLYVYWGNAQGGKTSGTVVRAPSGGGGTAVALTLEEESARNIALTPTYMFYTTETGVYGAKKMKLDSSCADGACVKISDKIEDAQGIVWDGDGTIYVADSTAGKVFSFPAGSLEEHTLTEVVPAAPRVLGLAFVTITAFARSAAALLLFAATC